MPIHITIDANKREYIIETVTEGRVYKNNPNIRSTGEIKELVRGKV